MFKSYFTLNRIAIELNERLKDFSITRAFSFEKEKLVFILIKYSQELSLEISVNPQLPYTTVKNKVSIPRRNLVDFFPRFFPSKIRSIEISDKDRIIKISSDKASIYFTIRGRDTNVFLISSGNEIESFKKSSEKIKTNFFDEISKSTFINGFRNIEIKYDIVDPTILRKEYPFIGKKIINEVKLREKEISDKISVNILMEVIENIRKDKPAVFIEEDE